jgi:hypothetical protein
MLPQHTWDKKNFQEVIFWAMTQYNDVVGY